MFDPEHDTKADVGNPADGAHCVNTDFGTGRRQPDEGTASHGGQPPLPPEFLQWCREFLYAPISGDYAEQEYTTPEH